MIHDESDGSRAFARGRVVVRPGPPPARPTTPVAPGPGPVPSPTSVADTDAADDGDLVDRLERLADLRRRGDITSAEYELAKARLLGTDGPST